jgi:hypothetical protein
MTDSEQILELAIQRRDDLKAELRKLEDFICALRTFRLQVRLEAPSESPEPQPKRRRARNPPPAEIIRNVKVVLKANGRPMSRRELVAALSERGVVLNSADPVKALGTTLWRSAEFQNYDGLGYWFSNQLPVTNPLDNA